MKTEEIKQIPIKDIMDRLGVTYSHAGANEYAIQESGKNTSGRRFNTEKNICYDFSKDRASGDTFGFVKTFLSLDDKDVFLRFSDNFGIKTNEIKSIYKIREALPELSQEQKEYLQGRGIKYEKIKDCVRNYNDAIGCLVYDNGIAKGLTARTLSKDHDKRFVSVTGYPTKGIYQSRLGEKSQTLIVVEGLVDFLSLKQFYSNVIGLKSAESGVEEVFRLNKDYEIIFCCDNDEAGKKTLEKFKGIKIKIFNPGEHIEGAKDVNDVVKSLGEDAYLVIDYIKENAKEVAPIDSTFEKLYKMQETIKERGQLGFDGPKELQMLYKYTSGVIPGMVYAIGAYSNTGKSKLACFHIGRFLKMGKKVCVISLEVAEWKYLMDIIQSHDHIKQQDMIGGYKPNQSDFRNLIIRDDLWTLSSITEYIKSIDSDIVFIDFVQNIQEKGSMYERNASIAQGIQKVASQTGKVIYAISQIDNSTAGDMKSGKTTMPKLKGAGEYFASSDVVIILHRDDLEKQYRLYLSKNKFGPANREYILDKDLNIGYFRIASDETEKR